MERVIPGQNGTYFVLRQTDEGPEVMRATVQAENARTELEEDRDEDIGTFNGYRLPTKGRAAVQFEAITDPDQQNRLLSTFARQDALDYAEWRQSVDEQYQDDNAGSLLLAREQWRDERDGLLNQEQTDDWSRQDNTRKGQWLQQNLRAVAESGDPRYSLFNYLSDYYPDFVEANSITPDSLALMGDQQADLINSLDVGDIDTANQILTLSQSTDESATHHYPP